MVDRQGLDVIVTPDWMPHPDDLPDVAVARFHFDASEGEIPFSYVPLSRFASPADFELPPKAHPDDPGPAYYMGELIGPGDDTVLVGRFLAWDGVLSQTPTVRFGSEICPQPVRSLLSSEGRAHLSRNVC